MRGLFAIIFGHRGAGVEDNCFKALSESTLKNRGLIIELWSKQRDIERRVWELEKHTAEENFERVNKMVAEFNTIADALKKEDNG